MALLKMERDLKPHAAPYVLQTATHGFGSGQARLTSHGVQGEPYEQQATCVSNGEGSNNYTVPPATTRLRRQFWSAGDYEPTGTPQQQSHNVRNRMCVHPKFLHSNATSHKWPFGAVAELLDNAVDEIQNGATTVAIEKVVDSRNGSPALLIQDDGGGMDPNSIRRCMSFGFSDKQPDSSIGQYGNGFKTSTMRLGADVIVFSRCMKSSEPTQSIGLLSYTFLRETGQKDVIVPTVDYKYNPMTGETKRFSRHSPNHFFANLSVMLKWSPFRTEEELIQNFDGIGHHGTKIIVFNLWWNDGGNLEFDFDTNEKDIIISGAQIPRATSNINQKHLANQLRYSLRVYASILYLHLPEYFKIVLRGQEVKRHSIVTDLKYLECIKYRPQVSGMYESEVVTSIGYLNGAPNVSIHGFNIYHRNRLILPFHRVLSTSSSKGRGVVGVLEANFIKPTHDKQGFEKSQLYQKLENRLKEMTNEYWDFHCHLIGYVNKPPHRAAAPPVENTGAEHLQGTPAAAADLPMTPSRLNTTVELSNTIPVSSTAHPPEVAVTAHTGASPFREAPIAPPLSLIPAKTNAGASQVRPLSIVPQDASVQLVQPPASAGFRTVKRKIENHIEIRSSKKQAIHDRIARAIGERERKELAFFELENRQLLEECMRFEEAQSVLLLREQSLRLEVEKAKSLYKNLLDEYNSVPVKIQG